MNLSTNDVLNKLLVIHTRSLPMYLSYALPWQVKNHPRFKEALENIVHLQQDMADRLATLVLDNGGNLDFGEFPMHFTGLHDLSVEYVLGQCIERQRKEVAIIEKCVSLLAMAPYAQAVAQEALGEAKGHLESLQAVTREESQASA